MSFNNLVAPPPQDDLALLRVRGAAAEVCAIPGPDFVLVSVAAVAPSEGGE